MGKPFIAAVQLGASSLLAIQISLMAPVNLLAGGFSFTVAAGLALWAMIELR